jgi:hypothetical protein
MKYLRPAFFALSLVLGTLFLIGVNFVLVLCVLTMVGPDGYTWKNPALPFGLMILMLDMIVVYYAFKGMALMRTSERRLHRLFLLKKDGERSLN